MYTLTFPDCPALSLSETMHHCKADFLRRTHLRGTAGTFS